MHVFTVLTILICLSAAGARGAAPAVIVEDGTVRSAPVYGPPDDRRATVALPRTWLRAAEALTAAHHQAGLLYAVLPPDFDAPVGPFRLGERIKVEELVQVEEHRKRLPGTLLDFEVAFTDCHAVTVVDVPPLYTMAILIFNVLAVRLVWYAHPYLCACVL